MSAFEGRARPAELADAAAPGQALRWRQAVLARAPVPDSGQCDLRGSDRAQGAGASGTASGDRGRGDLAGRAGTADQQRAGVRGEIGRSGTEPASRAGLRRPGTTQGDRPPWLGTKRLLSMAPLPMDWREQRRACSEWMHRCLRSLGDTSPIQSHDRARPPSTPDLNSEVPNLPNGEMAVPHWPEALHYAQAEKGTPRGSPRHGAFQRKRAPQGGGLNIWRSGRDSNPRPPA